LHPKIRADVGAGVPRLASLHGRCNSHIDPRF
jgi:hypothetical protein